MKTSIKEIKRQIKLPLKRLHFVVRDSEDLIKFVLLCCPSTWENLYALFWFNNVLCVSNFFNLEGGIFARSCLPGD